MHAVFGFSGIFFFYKLNDTSFWFNFDLIAGVLMGI